MNSREMRQKFFTYFMSKGHTKVKSSSLLPAEDPTLLFANAGMNQFKEVFLSKETRSYTRAVSIQKCVRAGGKHNDLDNVGFTKRHLTFFEMMGNFSFGDYFKKDAIIFAWEFLTKEIGLPAEKLHATIFETDDEAYDIWKTVIGLPEDRIHRLGAADNFWQMGDTGPCGPCTEIMFDRGPEHDTGSGDFASEGERYLEVWNLVFMQYNRQADGSDKILAQHGVDTGMGLERLALVVQNKDSVFETDLFTPIVAKIEELTGFFYATQNAEKRAAFHVLADHVRSASLIIADGAAPSNEGRGYVLRKIIRRAALFAQKLGSPDMFPKLASAFIDEMSDIYPELDTNRAIIISILTSEIEKFSQNLVRGQNILDRYISESNDTIITGHQAFKLYDTFGFPLELVQVIANEKGFSIDKKGFNQYMEQQRAQSSSKIKSELDTLDVGKIATEFTGYQDLETSSEITQLIHDGKLAKTVPAGQECWAIANRSPFFIVGGGQVPDNGWLIINNKECPLQEVRYFGSAIGARIIAPEDLSIGMSVISHVNKELRINAMKNHTATHLLQAALIELFGKQIKQSGSLVHPDYLRFDFTYHKNLSEEDIKQVEDLVNEKIRDDIPVVIETMPLKEALNRGALAFFGDKYNPENVRVIQIADFSTELCGGTHVISTGQIGTFKITQMSSLSAGHRRLVAVTGPGAMELFQDTFNTVKTLGIHYKVKPHEVLDAVNKQQELLKQAQQQIKLLKRSVRNANVPVWVNQVQPVGNTPFLFLSLEDVNPTELKEIAHHLNEQAHALYFLVSTLGEKTVFLVLDGTESIDIKALSSWMREQFGLRGGARNNQIQGGGTLPTNLKEQIIAWIKKQK